MRAKANCQETKNKPATMIWQSEMFYLLSGAKEELLYAGSLGLLTFIGHSNATWKQKALSQWSQQTSFEPKKTYASPPAGPNSTTFFRPGA